MTIEMALEKNDSQFARNLCFPNIEIVNSCVHNLTRTHFRSLL